MGDPCQDGVTEILRCDSSSLALGLEEPEATLIDCANQAAVSLNLSATILGCYLVGCVYPDLGIQTSIVEAQPDRGPGEWALVDLCYCHISAGPHARC